jgi:hypothetical protein
VFDFQAVTDKERDWAESRSGSKADPDASFRETATLGAILSSFEPTRLDSLEFVRVGPRKWATHDERFSLETGFARVRLFSTPLGGGVTLSGPGEYSLAS